MDPTMMSDAGGMPPEPAAAQELTLEAISARLSAVESMLGITAVAPGETPETPASRSTAGMGMSVLPRGPFKRKTPMPPPAMTP